MKFKKILKHGLLLSLFFTLTDSTLAQSHGLVYRQLSSIDLIIGGGLSFSRIETNSTKQQVLQEFNNRKQLERFKLNTRFGFNFYKGLNGSTSFKFGLRYANPGFQFVSVVPFNVSQDINTVEKEFIKDVGTNYKYNYQILEVPLGIKYVFARSWCASFVELGIAPSFYRQTVIEVIPAKGAASRIVLQENIKPFNFVAFLGLGGDFEIGDKFQGFTQIIGRYQINNLRGGTLIERVVDIGMEVGVRRLING